MINIWAGLEDIESPAKWKKKKYYSTNFLTVVEIKK